MLHCLICLASFEEGDEKCRCSDTGCPMHCCRECLGRFLDICVREQTVPRCMSPTCRALYLRTGIPSMYVQVYDLALYRGLLRDPGLEEDLRQREQRQTLLANIVEERRRFIRERFPASILLGVDILYPNELKRVEQNNEAFLRDVQQRTNSRRCFRSFCAGWMGLSLEIWTCGTCESRFCDICEQLMKGSESHVCRKEEVESVQWKRALPSCPSCHQPIEKSEGCRFMTCAVCRENFDYYTGELTAQGNHGQSHVVSLPQERITALYDLLLRGRRLEDLSMAETSLWEELHKMETTWDIKTDQASNWRVSQVMSSKLESEHHRDEAQTAKTIALRVERIERKRQARRTKLLLLRDMEDRILGLS